MKKIVLGICLSAFAVFFAQAQSLVMEWDTMHADGYNSQADIVIDNEITSNLGMTDSIRWIRIVNDLPANWQTLVCDPVTCYGPNTDTEAFDLDDNESGPIIIHFKPHGYVGCGTLVLRIFSYSDSATTSIDVVFTCCVTQAVGVETLNYTYSIELYPNPASDVLNLQNATSKSLAKVEIYNMLGSLINTVRFEKTKEINRQVDVSNLHQGLYIIKAFTADDEVIVSKTFKKAE